MQLLFWMLISLHAWMIVETETVEVDVIVDVDCKSGTCKQRESSDRRRHHRHGGSCCSSGCRCGSGKYYDKEKYFISDFETNWYRAREFCRSRKRNMDLLDVRGRSLRSSVEEAIQASGIYNGKTFWTHEKEGCKYYRHPACLYIENTRREYEFITGSCQRRRFFICERVD